MIDRHYHKLVFISLYKRRYDKNVSRSRTKKLNEMSFEQRARDLEEQEREEQKKLREEKKKSILSILSN